MTLERFRDWLECQRWSTLALNFDSDSRHMHTRLCAGRNLRQKYKQLLRQSSYARVYAHMEYKPSFIWANADAALNITHIQYK